MANILSCCLVACRRRKREGMLTSARAFPSQALSQPDSSRPFVVCEGIAQPALNHFPLLTRQQRPCFHLHVSTQLKSRDHETSGLSEQYLQHGLLRHLVSPPAESARSWNPFMREDVANVWSCRSRIVNMAVGVFMILGGIGQFWPSIAMYAGTPYPPPSRLDDHTRSGKTEKHSEG